MRSQCAGVHNAAHMALLNDLGQLQLLLQFAHQLRVLATTHSPALVSLRSRGCGSDRLLDLQLGTVAHSAPATLARRPVWCPIRPLRRRCCSFRARAILALQCSSDSC